MKIFVRLYIVLTFILISSFAITAQDLRVSLFYREQADNFIVTTQTKGCNLFVDDSLVVQLPALHNLTIGKSGSLVEVQIDSLKFTGTRIRVLNDSTESGFFINMADTSKKARAYTGKLEFYNDAGVLRAINIVPLESYVAATVEAEGGYNAHPEFYKTQAVICRTYALRNLDNHEAEGFQLCDGVHCQVYPFKAMDNDIIQAVEKTKGKVIVDSSFHLINAVYHSNSGGITANSKDVWSSQLPYLVSVEDTFSLAGKHADWQRRISMTEWRIFLENKGLNTENMKDEVLKRKLESRIAAMEFGSVSIPVKEIRHYFSLKSAYFDVDVEGDEVVLSGRGYGHGVGLSQEGAMRMAENGFGHEDIIEHYYSGTMVVNLKLLNIFKGLGKIGEE